MAKRKYTPIDRTNTCVNCGNAFVYQHATGFKQTVCSDACKKQRRTHLAAIRETKCAPCVVDGCDAPATRKGTNLCEVHYYRVRRTGAPSRKPISGRYVTGAGYIKLLVRGHPLADSNGHVYEHRAIAYKKNNAVCPGCHWCGSALDWDGAVIDHLNENKADNTEDNLVVTCNDCNRARGAMLPLVARLKHGNLEQFIGLLREHHERSTNT